MTTLQNPFEFAASDAAAEQVAAPSSQPPVQGAAADFCEPATDGGGPQESPASGQELIGAGDLEGDLSCIGEIFVGARKLGYVSNDLDPDVDRAAYPPMDELLYDVLKAADNPATRDLPQIPDKQALWEIIEPPPLFLQAAGY